MEVDGLLFLLKAECNGLQVSIGLFSVVRKHKGIRVRQMKLRRQATKGEREKTRKQRTMLLLALSFCPIPAVYLPKERVLCGNECEARWRMSVDVLI